MNVTQSLAKAQKELASLEKEKMAELAITAVDVAGMVDPTPASDLIGAGMSFAKGDFLGGALSLVSVIPYVGDAIAKPAKAARTALRVKKIADKIAKAKARIAQLKKLEKTAKASSKGVSKISDSVTNATTKVKGQFKKQKKGKCESCDFNAKQSKQQKAAAAKQKPEVKTNKASGENGNGQKVPSNDKTCTNGCPISMVAGEELLEQTDFVLSGPLAFIWNRTYRSSNNKAAELGIGWTTPLGEKLQQAGSQLFYFNQEGRSIPLPIPPANGQSYNQAEKLRAFDLGSDLISIKPQQGPEKIFRLTGSASSKQGQLVGLRDDCDNTIQITHGNAEQPTKLTTSWGQAAWFYHDPQGRIIAITRGQDSDTPPDTQPVVQYQYDNHSDLVAVLDALGHGEKYAYNNHIIIQRTLKSGFNFYFEWDQYTPQGKCVRNWGDNGIYDYQFAWFPEENRSTATDSRGAITQYSYNDNGQIISETDPLGGVTEHQYDDAGNVVSTVDPAGNTTLYEYNLDGLLIKVTDPEGNSHAIEYDDESRPTTLTDPLGNRWSRQYDERGLLVKTLDPEANQTQIDYNPLGLPVQITDAMGNARQLQWNEQAQLISQTDAEGQVTQYRYDQLGQVIASQDSQGAQTYYQYDDLGQPIAAQLPNGKQIKLAYNPAGQLTAFTDEVGRTTKYQYEGLAQVKKRIDPAGQVFEYFYDTERNLTGLKNENGETYQLIYDLNENLIQEVGFDGREQHYEYNKSGQLIKHIDGPRLPASEPKTADATETTSTTESPDQPSIPTTEFKRNKLGLLLEKQTSDGEVSTFQYDAAGRLTEANNNHRKLSFTYNAIGLLTEESQDNQTISHGYDPLGNRTSTTLPDGQSINYRYTPDGLFTDVALNGQLITQVRRDNQGREIGRIQGVVESQFEYDIMGRLTRHRVGSRETRQLIIQREYGYDNAGNLALIKDLKKGETQFQYDALDRLTVVNGIIKESFAHDPAGTILAQTDQPNGQSQGNRLLFQGDRHFAYDSRGNLTAEKRGKHGKLVTRYTYNHANQLIKVENASQTTEFTYDALGRRISKKDSFGETQFLWNGDVLLSETRENIHKTYLYEPESFRPLALVQDNQVYFYHLDHLGTPQEISDARGSIVWSVQYRAYGNVVRKQVEHIQNNLRFQGQYFDEETGLHYNRHRYYDPGLGRFINQDPIGLAGGTSLYIYAQNPVSSVDPYGLMPWAWNGETGMGHHLVPRGKANSVGLDLLSTKRHTPTYFPEPYQPGMHEELHRAQKPFLGKLQGPWKGTQDELIKASRQGLESLNHMKGVLKIPATGEIIASNVTPTEAFDKLTEWHDLKLASTKTKKDC
ncbi:RHS repeat-associated core domain-containing protein [Spartinivicinus marinus]|nr:RHS repeat-associated core domain-containing protein [Spartinivicinus marinus]MCX4027078.1 DUF6531 domain-containing protein [Spartinivicinus marinus]